MEQQGSASLGLRDPDAKGWGRGSAQPRGVGVGGDDHKPDPSPRHSALLLTHSGPERKFYAT